MSNSWGLALDAEISYRQQRVRSDYQRPRRRWGWASFAAARSTPQRANTDLRNAALAHAALAHPTSAPQLPSQRVPAERSAFAGSPPGTAEHRPARAA